MFAKYKIDVQEIRTLKRTYEGQYQMQIPELDFEEKRQLVRPSLKALVHGARDRHGVLDGAMLQNYTFPTGRDGDYDVFISHSHDDKDSAEVLASWLENCCHLRVFLDSYVWRSADGLLLEIDKLHCRKRNGDYIYGRRNYSTSHVHAMLSMAIMDIINKTECCIFIESNNSIDLNRLDNTSHAKTLSPWIYEELSMMRMLPSRGTRREVRYFSAITDSRLHESLEDLRIRHSVDLRDFGTLTSQDLLSLYNQGYVGLNHLYQQATGIDFLD